MHRSSDQEALLLQQLTQARYWQEKTAPKQDSSSAAPQDSRVASLQLPERWKLTEGITLHAWQEEAMTKWFASGQRGVMKVVTGAGKTLLALAIAERLQNTSSPDLHLAIVVPTIVLLDQWQEEIQSRSNLPNDAIGLLGGGYSDHFSERVRVLICVLNSASVKLPKEVEKRNISKNLLLVVDECHRAGATEMRRVFTTQRASSLGLSATPERNGNENDTDNGDVDQLGEARPFDETILGKELGPVVFELSYADAIERKVLPPFSISHFGLPLYAEERTKYERLSREITDLRRELETKNRRGLALIRWCRSPAAASDVRARRFISLTTERKRLLFSIKQRTEAVFSLLEAAYKEDESTSVILFHESIDEVMKLFSALRAAGYPVVAEHSEFPDAMRAESIRLFRKGIAKVIVSARSLIEGFNVPAADLGIIVAASSSVRQRVQTLGRLLRKGKRRDGRDKEARLSVLYAADTVDELIYEKADWDTFVGAERNEYFYWDVGSLLGPVRKDGPPRQQLKGEDSIEPTSINPGDVYEGKEEGVLYSRDTQGNVSDPQGHLMAPHADLDAILSHRMKGGGRFWVTPKRCYVVKLEKRAGKWERMFLGQLKTPLSRATGLKTDIVDESSLHPGSAYPIGHAEGKVFSVLQRDPRLIARKSKGQVSFVRPAAEVSDPDKRQKLLHLQKVLGTVCAKDRRINKIIVTNKGHVIYLVEGEAFFLGIAPEGENGFEFEE